MGGKKKIRYSVSYEKLSVAPQDGSNVRPTQQHVLKRAI